MCRGSLAIFASACALLTAAERAGAHVIAPGANAGFESNTCTLNFVLDGVGTSAGRVFLGTAAHCGQIGEAVRMGWDAVQAGDVIGRVVARGPYDSTSAEVQTTADDWALVEILPAYH